MYRLILLICALVVVCQGNHLTNINETQEFCPSARDPDFRLGGLHCCNVTFRNFSNLFIHGRSGLVYQLQKMKEWKCPQFDAFCSERYYNFNEYTDRLYDRFCEEEKFYRECGPDLSDVGLLPSNLSENTNVSLQYFSERALVSPCIQAASYEFDRPFVEVLKQNIPFCDVVVCGFPLDVHEAGYFYSGYQCYPKNCKINIIIVMVVSMILAVITTISNITVIIAIAGNSNFPTSQMIFKLSLGVADLIIGLIVFPSFVGTLYIGHIAPIKVDEYMPNYSSEDVAMALNKTRNYTLPDVNLTDFNLVDYNHTEYQGSRSFVALNSPPGYLSVIGFVTTLSLVISVYTLMLGGYDRFRAIISPLHYNKEKALKIAKRGTIILWVLAIVFSILPTFVPGFAPYSIIAAGIIVAASGLIGQLIYGIALGIPFILVWVFILGTYFSSKKHALNRRQMTHDRHGNMRRMEQRLSTTLAIMISVFTISILPVIIVIIAAEFLPNIHYNSPTRLNSFAASAYLSAELVAGIILISNSLWNCFIYSIRNKDFRDITNKKYKALAAVLGLFACKRCIHTVAHDGRRRISSAFALTTTRKTSATTISGYSTSRKESYAVESTLPETTQIRSDMQSSTII